MTDDHVEVGALGRVKPISLPRVLTKGAESAAPPGTCRIPTKAGMNMMMARALGISFFRASSARSVCRSGSSKRSACLSRQRPPRVERSGDGELVGECFEDRGQGKLAYDARHRARMTRVGPTGILRVNWTGMPAIARRIANNCCTLFLQPLQYGVSSKRIGQAGPARPILSTTWKRRYSP
jgi:hypothetical protein